MERYAPLDASDEVDGPAESRRSSRDIESATMETDCSRRGQVGALGGGLRGPVGGAPGPATPKMLVLEPTEMDESVDSGTHSPQQLRREEDGETMIDETARGLEPMDAHGSVEAAHSPRALPDLSPQAWKERFFELREYKVRGFRIPQLLNLLGALALPTADGWLDWALVIKWYLGGDVHWFQIGLTINLLSGSLSAVLLRKLLVQDLNWHWFEATFVGFIIGALGLAPAACAAVMLYKQNAKDATRALRTFKALELVFEALPQSILQCAPTPQPPRCQCTPTPRAPAPSPHPAPPTSDPNESQQLVPPYQATGVAQDVHWRGIRQVRPFIADFHLPASRIGGRFVGRSWLHILRLRDRI
eukprot:COSAG04_NODE_131_length_24280_cov_40.563418_14_plen_360_part_00